MTLLQDLSPLRDYLLISLVVWVTYIYVVLKCGFVSDDIPGIAHYDGKLQGSEYGMLSRWLRYKVTGGDFPSSLKAKDQVGNAIEIPEGKIPRRHHILIISVFNISCLLSYLFLKNVLGAKMALLTVLLFAVHPCGVQAVAWCSGLGYPLSLFWIMSMLNLVQWHNEHATITTTVITTIVFCLFQFMGVHAQIIPAATGVILWFLGFKTFAILALLISGVMMFDIVHQTIKLRKDEFVKQMMGESTKLNARKFVVACKTFLYYLGLTLVPSKMGLYHKWGFHYSKDLERHDKPFILGFLAAAGLAGIFFLCPVIQVKLAILWFISFLFIFLNWITIQQFITERYIFIPSLGTCMLLTYLTRDYFWVYALIFGLYLCRTWLHLPTYDNELRFYQSNHWNFPDSEVALGNLGVTYVNLGMDGAAMDAWRLAATINPEYDVPWYNLFSTLRKKAADALQAGDYAKSLKKYQEAYPYLERTVACKVCHFPEMWKKEQTDLLALLKNPSTMYQDELQRLRVLGNNLQIMMNQAATPQRVNEVQISVQNNNAQMNQLLDFMNKNGISILNNNDLFSLLNKGAKK